MTPHRDANDAVSAFARIEHELTNVSMEADRRARSLRRVGGASMLAAQHAAAREQAETVMRELRRLQAMGLTDYLFGIYADVRVEREHDVTKMGILGMVPLDDGPQLGRVVDSLHGDSPSRGAA